MGESREIKPLTPVSCGQVVFNQKICAIVSRRLKGDKLGADVILLDSGLFGLCKEGGVSVNTCCCRDSDSVWLSNNGSCSVTENRMKGMCVGKGCSNNKQMKFVNTKNTRC